MANSEQWLVSPPPMTLSSSANGFISNWADKRSAPNFGISIVFYGANAPDGYAWIETSNAPMQSGSGVYGQPNNGGDDATEYPSSQQTIVLNALTGLYGCQWQVQDCGAHYVRVRYTSQGNVSGLSVNVYFNGVFSSP